MPEDVKLEEHAPLLQSRGTKLSHAYKRFRQWRKTCGPDGVEAWSVAMAACFIHFIMAGTARSMGIFYVKVIDIFKVDRKQASFPFTVRSMTRNLLGPAVGILGQKYGVRPIVIVGCIISTISAALCFFVKDILWMTILWGVCNGFGASLITTLIQAAIGEHFVKHKSMAAGMGFSGGCIGSFVFPPFLEFLLYEYDLGGTFLFLAGIIMHVLPAAILMKRPSWSKNKTTIAKGNVISNVSAVRPQKIENQRQPSFKKIDDELLLKNKQLVLRLLTDDFKLKYSPTEIIHTKLLCDTEFVKDIEDLFSKIFKDGHSNSIINENEYDSRHILRTNGEIKEKELDSEDTPFTNGCQKVVVKRQAEADTNKIDCVLFYLEKLNGRNEDDLFSLFEEDGYEIVSKIYDQLRLIYSFLTESSFCMFSNSDEILVKMNSGEFEGSIEQPNTICSHIKTALWLHTKPMFILICLCRTSHFLTFIPLMTIVVDLGRDKGVPEIYGSYIIAALSAGDLIGRLFSGWITDRGFLTLPRYMLIFSVLQGISTFILAFMNSLASFMITLTIYGLLQGCVFIQHPVLVSRYLGKNEQSIALGCINFMSGFLGFALPFYIGYFRDTMGSYDGMLFINGAVGGFVGLLFGFEKYINKLSEPTEKKIQPTQV